MAIIRFKASPMVFVKAGVLLAVGGYFIWRAFNPEAWFFLDWFNLLIHEAGHMIFMFGGQFIHVLGGTLMQLLMPTVFVGYFLWHKKIYSASFVILWLGQNLINVSVYARDGLVMKLPLLGGDNGIHDWNYLLRKLHLLQQAETVGDFIWTLGFLVIIVGLLVGLWALFRGQTKQVDFNEAVEKFKKY